MKAEMVRNGLVRSYKADTSICIKRDTHTHIHAHKETERKRKKDDAYNIRHAFVRRAMTIVTRQKY